MSDDLREVDAAADVIVKRLKGGAGRVVVFTGAGVSAESGIPTFRDALTGYWSRFRPEELATPEAFDRDPAAVSRWYDERRLACAWVAPNGAHEAIARLQQAFSRLSAVGGAPGGGGVGVITQNVDGLHQRAGAERVVELHGSLSKWRCARTGAVWLPPEPPDAIREYPPRTEGGGLARPGVVWFGEMLPAEAIAEAERLARGAEVFLSIGTSAVVYPAAGLIDTAMEAGALCVELNPEPTPYSGRVDLSLRCTAAGVMPRLVDLVLAGIGIEPAGGTETQSS